MATLRDRFASLRWLSTEPLPMWGGHLERGEPLSDPEMRQWIEDEWIRAVDEPRKGYVLTDKGREVIRQHRDLTIPERLDRLEAAVLELNPGLNWQ